MPILLDFTTPKHKKYFLSTLTDWAIITLGYVFLRAKVFGKFLLHNWKICLANVVKTQIRQNL